MKKISICLSLFLTVCLLLNTSYADAPIIQDMPIHKHARHRKHTRQIIPGTGYAHDSQQITPNICYNVKINAITGQQGALKLNSAISFDELEKELHKSIRGKAGFGRFSAGAQADYLRSMQDLDYSLSLNYYEFLFNNVMLQLKGVGLDILTQQGKAIYTKAYPFFNLLCGDDYISSYQQGAILLMGINIRFSSHLDKEQFTASAKVSFGNLVNAAAQIQNFAKQYHLHGLVIIQAYQQGGNPSELSKILSKEPSGVYNALSCDLQHMESCVKAANGLLTYAAEIFPKQISFKKGQEIGLTPLGEGFLRHDPVAEYGIVTPPSLVTNEVIKDRESLANALDENQYYQQKLNELLFGYPVPLDHNSHIYKTAAKLYQQVNNNIDYIMMPMDADDGALKCYNHPAQCHQTLEWIQSRLKALTETDFKFLTPIKNTVHLSFWPQTNDWFPNDDSGTQFLAPTTQFGNFTGKMTLSSEAISDINLHIVMGPGNWEWIYLVGKLTKNNNGYKGVLWCKGAPCNNYTAQVLPNPFYIQAYQE